MNCADLMCGLYTLECVYVSVTLCILAASMQCTRVTIVLSDSLHALQLACKSCCADLFVVVPQTVLASTTLIRLSGLAGQRSCYGT